MVNKRARARERYTHTHTDTERERERERGTQTGCTLHEHGCDMRDRKRVCVCVCVCVRVHVCVRACVCCVLARPEFAAGSADPPTLMAVVILPKNRDRSLLRLAAPMASFFLRFSRRLRVDGAVCRAARGATVVARWAERWCGATMVARVYTCGER
jgi:hypothetical protein